MELTLTPAARAAANSDLAADERLRIAFAGGCGALGFRIAAARRALDGDISIEADGVHLWLDRRAAEELDGAVLDHRPDEGYLLDHPAWGVAC